MENITKLINKNKKIINKNKKLANEIKHLLLKAIDEENEIIFNREEELKNMQKEELKNIQDDMKMIKKLHKNTKEIIINQAINYKSIKKIEKVLIPDAETRYALNDNEICFCLCGGKFIKHNKARHEKTERHNYYINKF